MTSSAQRKQGISLFKPVSWNNGRRFTSPGPAPSGGQGVDQGVGKGVGTGGILNPEGPLLRLQIEAYLDDHPEFTESYILRKVERNVIDKWLTDNAVTTDQSNPRVQIDRDTPRKISQDSFLDSKKTSYSQQMRAHYSADCTPVKRRSLSVTPHRKISAATFEEGGCQSPLLTMAEDGSVSFLTVPPPAWRRHSMRLSSGQRNNKKISVESITDNTGVATIPSHLHDNLSSDMNLGSLCFKIAKNLAIFSRSLSVSVLQVKKSGSRHYLSGSAVEVTRSSEDDREYERPNLSLPPDLSSCLINMIQTGQPVSFPRETVEQNFGSDISILSGKDSSSYTQLSLIPLIDTESVVQGVAILAHLGEKIANNKLVTDIAKLSGICMKNAADFQSMSLEVTRSQMFLDLARVIFDQQSSIEFTVLKILVNFLSLIECERAQILLSCKESPTKFNKVFDLEENDLNREDFSEFRAPFENRFPINQAVTALVATVGETVNIGDISNDDRFDSETVPDQMKSRSLLCMPLLDSEKQIIGVVTLANKKTGGCFTSNDESFVEAFGVFCGISLTNVGNLEVVKAAEARSQVALEIMSYHASSSVEEAEYLAKQTIPSTLSLQLQSFSFTDIEMEDIDTLKASLRMFYDLDLVKKTGLEPKTLSRWILTVKKNYRPEVLYHNWRHAFNVAQVMFSCLLNSGWWEGLGPLTCLGLIVACLCHDLDHRGTNNNYQMATNSPLALLYSTSTLERHHLNQALIILNLEGNRILENLSPTHYTKVLSVIEEAILATDLSLHFQHLGQLLQLSAEGPSGLDWTDDSKVSVTMAALMTASDLGATTRPWETQREVAALVAEEFWSQGDLEREQLDKQPIPMMDRDLRHELPRLQVGFCDGVCLPVYKSLSSLSPALRPLEDAVTFNRDRWAELAENNQEEDEEEENKVTRNL